MIQAFLFSVPFTLRVVASLLIILLVHKYFNNLAAAAVTGTVLLSFWCGHSVTGALTVAWGKVSAVNTIMLVLAVVQIIILSLQMSETGVMKDLVDAIRSKLPRKISIALLPAVIGLLPMPGGAIFSAPLVDQCDDGKMIEPMLKTEINYWFRHIWEYWWPLYPGVLLAVEITGLSIPRYMLLLMPLSAAAAASGYFFFLRKVGSTADRGDSRAGWGRVFRLISPILIIVAGYAVISVAAPSVRGLNKYLPMMIAILIAQTSLQAARPIPAQQWRRIVLNPSTLKLMILVLSILVYGAFIDAPLPGGSRLVDHMRDELAMLGIPVIVIVMAIPFISGLSTGLSIGFVGASFPIVLSLIGSDPAPAAIMATTVLAFGSGFTGMILSPVHICLIVSNDHFETDLGGSIVGLLPASAAVMCSALILHFFIKCFF